MEWTDVPVLLQMEQQPTCYFHVYVNAKRVLSQSVVKATCHLAATQPHMGFPHITWCSASVVDCSGS